MIGGEKHGKLRKCTDAGRYRRYRNLGELGEVIQTDFLTEYEPPIEVSGTGELHAVLKTYSDAQTEEIRQILCRQQAYRNWTATRTR